MKYLIDTNVICENTKPKPHQGVVNFLKDVDPEDLYISVLTIGEIRKGIERIAPKLDKKQRLQSWLERDLVSYFSGRILPINIQVAEKWGYLLGNSRYPLSAIDSLIAATAICNNLTLVTRNTNDFNRLPVEIFNPYMVASTV